VHLFARTRASPFTFYYNRFRAVQQFAGHWDGWQDMKIQMPFVADAATGKVGGYLAPVVFDGRLLVFTPEISQQTVTDLTPATPPLTIQDLGAKPPDKVAPQKCWEFKMSWTEYRNGVWMPRQTCIESYLDTNNTQRLTTPDVTSYMLVPCLLWEDGHAPKPPAAVAVYLCTTGSNPSLRAGWNFDGRQLSLFEKNVVTDSTFMVTEAGNRYFQVLQPDTTKPLANVPDAPALFSLQGSHTSISPGPILRERPQVQMDGAVQFVEDADSYSQFVSLGQADTTIDPQGPSVVPIPVDSSTAGMNSVRLAAQRFYHGSIHQLLRAANTGTDVSGLFDALASVQAGPWAQLTPAQRKDFCEAFGAIDPSTAFRGQKNGTAILPPIPITNASAVSSPAKPAIGPSAATGATKALAAPSNRSRAIVMPSQEGNTAADTVLQFDQRSRLYSLYNWELGMHACMTLMDSLLKVQQFEQARNVAHYVFDPFASGDKSDPSRFWKFPPFKVVSVATIESLFLQLEAGKPK
jgi:hypothetical protein